MNNIATSSPSIFAIISKMKDELEQFLQTRLEILRQEVRDILRDLEIAAPLAAIALLLIAAAYLLVNIALAAAIAAMFNGSPYQWFLGFLILGVLWGSLGAIAAYFSKRELELKVLKPKRTIEILQGDKVWLQRQVAKL